MKIILQLIVFYILLWVSFKCDAQIGQTISVSGRHILGPCGDTLILKGVNYAVYNWGWSPTQNQMNQIGLSGANSVRIVWYKTPTGATPISTYGNMTNLDSAFSKCIQQKMIPILDLHDQTCQNNPSALINLSNWYLQPSVLALINKYKHSLIINIANEALFVNWTGNVIVAQTTFTNTYTTIVTNLRNAGITVPLMIDGPDCGTNLNVLSNVGNTLQNNDPLHNLIFSAHAYWYNYANNDSLQMLSIINTAVNANIPFLFGEIANTQDDATMCQYSLNYRALLNICTNKNIGWFAWSWDNDGCPSRQVTTAGLVSNLTTYGNEILNNSNFGLLNNPPKKSQYLINNGCQFSTKLFLNGYYLSLQTMRNVLHLQNVTPASLFCDTISVALHQQTFPFAKIYETKAILQTNGNCNIPIPLSVIGNMYYLAIKHRNTITTWSANAILINANTKYDFSSNATKAYGNNMMQIEPNVWALFSGDINQDHNIDLIDGSLLESEINNFSSGYRVEDINGDGNVDILDSSPLENNMNSFVFAMHP